MKKNKPWHSKGFPYWLSEKSEAKAAGQKCSPGVVFSTLRTFLADNAGIGLCSRPQ
ncbi:MAG TPA: hypothetical protein VMW72_23345 [Sedimentisphaerales bacterium]|nr:hypothetical protein [Sedimentisphaerales bacterium]